MLLSRLVRTALVLSAGLASSLAAQAGPAARDGHAMTFHARLGEVVVFGGEPDSLLWAWDGTRWRSLGGEGPGRRKHLRIVYDEARDRIVLYGGLSRTEFHGDTWEWDGTRWALVATDGPGPRGGYAMAYDPERRQVILFGGMGPGRQYYTDTWAWDGRTWTRVATDGPPGRFESTMVYDQPGHRIILSGGAGSAGPARMLADTWAWNGRTWLHLGPAPELRWARLVTDPLTSRPLLHGASSDSSATAETWRWSGSDWQRLASVATPARPFAAAAHDFNRKRAVWFGGLDRGTSVAETREWDGEQWLDRTTQD